MWPILLKMHEVIGADPEKTNFNAQDWFGQHTWTMKQTEDFQDWIVEWLGKQTIGVRYALVRGGLPKYGWWRTVAKKWAKEFTMNYGWRWEDPKKL